MNILLLILYKHIIDNLIKIIILGCFFYIFTSFIIWTIVKIEYLDFFTILVVLIFVTILNISIRYISNR